MNAVFADTVYWVATLRPDDPWRSAALQAYRRISPVRLVTTDEVLVEFLALVSGADPGVRKRAAMLVRALLSHPNVDVYAQSRESFLGGLSLYEVRPDKGYSLTDCIAMNTMRAAGITEVLTSDHHFEQEGFVVLMKR